MLAFKGKTGKMQASELRRRASMPEDIADKRAKGGHARAESLTARERTDIAKKAASARWDKDIPAHFALVALRFLVLSLKMATKYEGSLFSEK